MTLMAVKYTWISIQSIEHKFWTEMNNFSEFIAHLSQPDFLSKMLKLLLQNYQKNILSSTNK